MARKRFVLAAALLIGAVGCEDFLTGVLLPVNGGEHLKW